MPFDYRAVSNHPYETLLVLDAKVLEVEMERNEAVSESENKDDKTMMLAMRIFPLNVTLKFL